MAYNDDEAIMVQRLSWSGLVLGPAITVSAAAGCCQHSPTLVQATTGEFLILWIRERYPFSNRRSRLWGRWLEADGTPRGAAFWVSPGLTSTITAAAAAADGLGNVIVAHHIVQGVFAAAGHVFARRMAPETRTGTLQWHAPTSERFEGDTQAAITVVRSGGSDGAVAVHYRTAGGSATASIDYRHQDGVICFGDGETGAKSVPLPLRDDTEVEAGETIMVTLSNATGGAVLVSPERTTVSIIDNDFTTAGIQQASAMPPFQLSPAMPHTETKPAAATHASGARAVAWVEEHGFTGNRTVYARRLDRLGRPHGEPIAIGEAELGSGIPGITNRPALAFDATGGFLVVWGAGALQGRYVDASGRPAGEAFEIKTRDCTAPSGPLRATRPYHPTVLAVGAGIFAVVWNDENALSSVRFRLVDRHGEARSALGLVSFDAVEGHAAAYADGSFIVVWNPLEERGLRAQRYNAAGTRLGDTIFLDPFALSPARPAVATGPGTRAFVAYQKPGTRPLIHGMRLEGDTADEPFLISTAPDVHQINPAVAVDGENNVIVAWESQGLEGTGTGLYARRINFDGQPRGKALRVMATPRGDQRNVVLTAGPRGDALAVWEGETPAGESDILSRLLPTRCGSNARALCLGGDRFLVEVEWEDFAGSQGHGQAVDLTADTGGFWFFDQDNIELVVKVLDGSANNGHHWVFYGALSNVAFDLTVTDLESGVVARYSNPLGTFASVGDITALPALGTPAAASTVPTTSKRLASTAGFATFPTLPDATNLCLGDGRFQASALRTSPAVAGPDPSGQARPLTPDSGTFSFFDEDNIELIIKVLDGTAANGHYWIFYGALSNIGYTVTVTDTLTGITKTYDNPSGTFASIGDTTALPAER